MDIIFAAKKGKGFRRFLIITGASIALVSYGVPFLANAFSLQVFLINSLLVLPVLTLFVWCWYGTQYQVGKSQLKIKCGPFRWIIPFEEIKKIYLNQSTIGGIIKPTLSWDCMEIAYGQYKTISITPENQDQFIAMLKSKNGHFEIK
ncbi:MAG: PH domain-containing protein [Cyclobacteriaceae bacterium]|nr:PH domain-containing protein [Cyclobacteriaceae bacterium]